MRRFNELSVVHGLAWLPRRAWAVLGPDVASARQSLAALGINSSTSLVAGAVLGSITGTFDEHPGLLVMVPAAIGLRGNIFAALGSRVSTTIHAGQFTPSLRRGSVLGDNAAASMGLTLLLAVVLAVTAAAVSSAFGVPGEISVLDLVTVSVLGGFGASTIVLGVTLTLVSGAVRWGWDLDNLVAPVVSTVGDVVTVPALLLGTLVLDLGDVTAPLRWATLLVAVGVGTWIVRPHRRRVRHIVGESLPVLTGALVLSTLAGIVLEHELATFDAYPALLILTPAFVSSAGALGGVLAASLGTGLHLGTVAPSPLPSRVVRHDMTVVAALAAVVYVFNGLGAHVTAALLGVASPGIANMVTASLLGGIAAVAFALMIAYYSTLVAVRLRLDPDTYGIPLVTSSVDFTGTLALVAVVGILGFAA